MVSVAAGLGLGGAQKAFQASEQLRSREGIEQNKIKEARRQNALTKADAAIVSLSGALEETSQLLVEAEPGIRLWHELLQPDPEAIH